MQKVWNLRLLCSKVMVDVDNLNIRVKVVPRVPWHRLRWTISAPLVSAAIDVFGDGNFLIRIVSLSYVLQCHPSHPINLMMIASFPSPSLQFPTSFTNLIKPIDLKPDWLKVRFSCEDGSSHNSQGQSEGIFELLCLMTFYDDREKEY